MESISVFFAALIPLLVSAHSLTVLYTNNFNGMLKSCGCPGNEYGGIVFAAAYVNEVREQVGDHLLVDAGDFLPIRELPVEAQFAATLMSQMHYDAITVGDQEFALGAEFLIGIGERLNLPLVNVCLTRADSLVFQPFIIKNFPWGKVGISGYISSSVFEVVDPLMAGGITLAPAGKMSEILRSLAEETDVTILLAHAPLEQCRQIAREYPCLDLIVAAHEQRVQTTPIREGETYIVEAGRSGEYLGWVELFISEGRVMEATDFSVRVAPRALDPKLEAIYRDYESSREEYVAERELLHEKVTAAMHDQSECATCHFAQARQFEATAHASSFATLEKYGAADNLICLGCHTTGFAQPGGFVSASRTPRLRNVSCVSCHTELALADLKEHSASASTRVAVSETHCLKCHTSEWSPHFDYQDYYEHISHKATYHVVVSGDWLSKLSRTYYGNVKAWEVIFEANRFNISDPDLIYPGQKVLIPKLRPSQKRMFHNKR